jgi:hypothetical protein
VLSSERNGTRRRSARGFHPLPCRPYLAPMVPSPVSGPAITTTTTPTFRKKHPTFYLTPVHLHAQYHHHHHQRYSRPRSRNTHTRHGHGASPTPVFPVHRPSSHHDALLIGPVSRTVRRCQWAHSAHLHEVHRIHHPHYHHHHCSSSSSSSRQHHLLWQSAS